MKTEGAYSIWKKKRLTDGPRTARDRIIHADYVRSGAEKALGEYVLVIIFSSENVAIKMNELYWMEQIELKFWNRYFIL